MIIFYCKKNNGSVGLTRAAFDKRKLEHLTFYSEPLFYYKDTKINMQKSSLFKNKLSTLAPNTELVEVSNCQLVPKGCLRHNS
jgi:hypothetical protein